MKIVVMYIASIVGGIIVGLFMAALVTILKLVWTNPLWIVPLGILVGIGAASAELIDKIMKEKHD